MQMRYNFIIHINKCFLDVSQNEDVNAMSIIMVWVVKWSPNVTLGTWDNRQNAILEGLYF